MPRKPATATKKVAAKKTTSASGRKTSKSAAPALAKKVAAKKTTKKTAAKKSESASGAPRDVDSLAGRIIDAIKQGEFDGHIADLDDAITARINKQATAKKTAAKKPAASGERKVSSAPKRKTDAPVEAEPGKTYKISSKVKKLAGAKVKFIRPSAKDENKGMMEMLVDKPGYPKGKRFLLPLSALTK